MFANVPANAWVVFGVLLAGLVMGVAMMVRALSDRVDPREPQQESAEPLPGGIMPPLLAEARRFWGPSTYISRQQP